jgi:hypothetical protein
MLTGPSFDLTGRIALITGSSRGITASKPQSLKARPGTPAIAGAAMIIWLRRRVGSPAMA